MNESRLASLLAVLALTTWSCAGYVADTSVAPGDRVRVTAPSLGLKKEVGAVAALETRTLIVNSDDRADALDVPLADVTKLEVHRGQKARAGKGALIGAAVGAAAGVTVAIVGCAGNACSVDVGRDYTPVLAVVLGVGGALLGAGFGALIDSGIKVDRWETVRLDEIRVGPSPVTADGSAITVSIRFFPRLSLTS